MMESRLVLATEQMNGVLHGSDATFAGVSTDTRSLLPGQLFFALQGPNFDGTTFVDAAREKGAAGAVVATRCDSDLPQIVVATTAPAAPFSLAASTNVVPSKLGPCNAKKS